MARRPRKQNKSFLDELLDAPWQVSIVVGVLAFIGLKWIFPSMAGGNMFLKPLAQAASGIAWIAFGFFFLIGLAVFAKSAAAKAKLVPQSATNGSGYEHPSAWREKTSNGEVGQDKKLVAFALSPPRVRPSIFIITRFNSLFVTFIMNRVIRLMGMMDRIFGIGGVGFYGMVAGCIPRKINLV